MMNTIFFCIAIEIPMVMNVEVEVISASSVRVSWDSLGPEITGYIVYYSHQAGNAEQSISVSNTINSVVVENLMNVVEYQFQVVAVSELDGDEIMGERSITVQAPQPTYISTQGRAFILWSFKFMACTV